MILNLAPTELIHRALFGIDDEPIRQLFMEQFGDQVRQFETRMTLVYESWQEFDKIFTHNQNQDSATVAAILFTVIVRIILSMKLLITGHITLAGAAYRQVIEAIALALLFSKRGLPYLREYWDGKFRVHRAVKLLDKHRNELGLDKEAFDLMKNKRNFYHTLSHPTILAMGDIISLEGAGIYLGASYDEAKLPFYEKEVSSRVNLANILINVIEAVTRQMREWPCFAETSVAK
jgi:hypothetical protein